MFALPRLNSITTTSFSTGFLYFPFLGLSHFHNFHFVRIFVFFSARPRYIYTIILPLQYLFCEDFCFPHGHVISTLQYRHSHIGNMWNFLRHISSFFKSSSWKKSSVNPPYILPANARIGGDCLYDIHLWLMHLINLFMSWNVFIQ